jgi:ATP-binding cassette subfamily B protein
MSHDAIYDDDAYRGHLDWGLWRRIAAHAWPYRLQLGLLGGAGLVVAAVDAALPVVTGRLIDAAVAGAAGEQLLAYGLGYGLLLAVFAVCVWAFITLAGQTATGVAYDLRKRGFQRLQELPFAYFDVRPVGWLVTRLTSDCEKLSSLMPWFLLDLIWGTSLIVAITGCMLILDWRLALAVLAIVPPLTVLSVVFQRKLLESSRLIRRKAAIMAASFNECLMGVRTTKALVREEGNLEEFQVHSTDMYAHSMRNALQSAVYLPMVMCLGSVGVGLALWRGGLGVELGGVSLGTLVTFMQFAALFTMPIQELAERFTQVQAAQAAAERVQGLLETAPEIRDAPEVCEALARHEAAERPEGVAVDGGDARIETIEFRQVAFAYKAGEPVLSGFDLTVQAGQTVALVGATGGGKSTIVSLLARFYEPTAGEVLINGVDYRRRSLRWLQSNLGVVLQVPHLFSGTVREAIRYGRLDASDDEVEQAARLVGAHDFVSDLPDGYDAQVGEGGGRLSTGQRQLIALARAVLADPQVFIMDEATSSVDTSTEALIQDAVDTVLEGRTAFVIAHRLSTIRRADRILVIDAGRVVESGTHRELLARRGRYHALYTRQLAREEGARLARAPRAS